MVLLFSIALILSQVAGLRQTRGGSGPMLAVQPTVELAKRNSRQRIDPLIEESAALRERVKPARSRDAGNTMLSKEFAGGILIMTGANSAVGLRLTVWIRPFPFRTMPFWADALPCAPVSRSMPSPPGSVSSPPPPSSRHSPRRMSACWPRCFRSDGLHRVPKSDVHWRQACRTQGRSPVQS